MKDKNIVIKNTEYLKRNIDMKKRSIVIKTINCNC